MSCYHLQHHLIGNLPASHPECFPTAESALAAALDSVLEVAESYPEETDEALHILGRPEALSHIKGLGLVLFVGRVQYEVYETEEACPEED